MRPPLRRRRALAVVRSDERMSTMKSMNFLVAIALVAIAGTAHAAGNVKAGRQKALQCQPCHGIDGLSKIPDAPNIAGSPEPYLVRQLDAFRKGSRQNDMMSVVAKPLSDQDIADL